MSVFTGGRAARRERQYEKTSAEPVAEHKGRREPQETTQVGGSGVKRRGEERRGRDASSQIKVRISGEKQNIDSQAAVIADTTAQTRMFAIKYRN